jgi:hypothetical protein
MPVPLLLSAVGLLLTLTNVNGFGFDVANDSVGYVLIAVGSVSVRPRTAWWSALAVASAIAAAVGLFTYGGVVSTLVPGSYVLWEPMSYASSLLAGAVVALLATALTGVAREPGRTAFLLVIAVATVVLAVVAAVMRILQIGISGPASYLLQLTVVGSGLLAIALLVLVFLAMNDMREFARPPRR